MKKITVFILYYNDEKYLSESISSVLSQSYSNFELILLNHASTDKSEEIAKSFNDNRIKHIKMNKNYYYGGGVLLQKALENATGEYLKLFCADDIMLPNCLSDLANFLDKNDDYIGVFGFMNTIDDTGKSLQTKYQTTTNLDRYQKLFNYFNSKNFFSYPTALIKMSAIKNILTDKVSLQLYDVSTWIKLLLIGDLAILPVEVVNYRLHSEQPSTYANPQIAKFKRREDFERQFILDIFTKITDFSLLKKIFSADEKIEALQTNEAEFIPFLVCLQALNTDDSMSFRAITLLYEMLQNDDLRNKIEEKYNYTIADLRQINCNYTISNIKSKKLFKTIKHYIKIILIKLNIL